MDFVSHGEKTKAFLVSHGEKTEWPFSPQAEGTAQQPTLADCDTKS